MRFQGQVSCWAPGWPEEYAAQEEDASPLSGDWAPFGDHGQHLHTLPPAGRYWETVQRLRVNQFYGAPTAIRLLLKLGDGWVKKYDRSSLRTLGSGECTG